MSLKARSLLTSAITILAVTLAAAAGAAAAPKLKVLHSFGGQGDGIVLWGGLVRDPKGNVYGTTVGGGAYSVGTVFELASGPDGRWDEKILHSFISSGSDGEGPMGTPALDSAGNLYATTNGGRNNYGTVFEMIRGESGWTLNVLYRFHGGDSDSHPTGPLIMDAAGNLYGTAYWPFELSPGGNGSWTFTLLQNSPYPGSNGGLAMDQAGNLYGTTPHGGGSNGCGAGCGTAYKLHRDSKGNWNSYILLDFDPASDELSFPEGVLALDKEGNLYGVAAGGAHRDTALYELSPSSDPATGWKVTILHSFGVPSQGVGGTGGVVFDKAGNVYGMTASGGDPSCECGVIYKMTREAHGNWKYGVLYRFHGYDGVQPYARPILDGKGHLYGTTVIGGAFNGGVAFELTP